MVYLCNGVVFSSWDKSKYVICEYIDGYGNSPSDWSNTVLKR